MAYVQRLYKTYIKTLEKLKKKQKQTKKFSWVCFGVVSSLTDFPFLKKTFKYGGGGIFLN